MQVSGRQSQQMIISTSRCVGALVLPCIIAGYMADEYK